MRVAVILNGISLRKEKFYGSFVPVIRQHFDVEVFETHSAHDAVNLGSMAVLKKFDVVLSAGGDGTLHQVLNGMLRESDSPGQLPILGVVPWGSGNDFARTLGLLRPDASATVQAIRESRVTLVDVGEVEYTPVSSGPREMRYFINVVDAGMGPVVVRGVLASGRAFGSSLAYYQSIIRTFFTFAPKMTHVISDDWEWHSKMRTFAIGNGKFYGNGLAVCPDAKPDDGVFDVFACGGVSVLDFIIQSIPMKKGRKINHKEVTYRKTTCVHLSSDETVEIEADGEILGVLPATVRLSDRKIRILMG